MSKYNLLKGMCFSGEVLHVGAHIAQEINDYESMGFSKAWWIEGNPRVLLKLLDTVKRHKGKMKNMIIDAIVSDKIDTAVFNIANNDQSSSLLAMGTHKAEYPHINYINQITVETTTINALHSQYNFSRVKFLSLDVQGAELLVLRGGTHILPNIDYVFTEVNIEELYKGCVRLPDLTAYLKNYGLELVDTVFGSHGWGDALYIRKDAV